MTPALPGKKQFIARVVRDPFLSTLIPLALGLWSAGQTTSLLGGVALECQQFHPESKKKPLDFTWLGFYLFFVLLSEPVVPSWRSSKSLTIQRRQKTRVGKIIGLLSSCIPVVRKPWEWCHSNLGSTWERTGAEDLTHGPKNLNSVLDDFAGDSRVNISRIVFSTRKQYLLAIRDKSRGNKTQS